MIGVALFDPCKPVAINFLPFPLRESFQKRFFRIASTTSGDAIQETIHAIRGEIGRSTSHATLLSAVVPASRPVNAHRVVPPSAISPLGTTHVCKAHHRSDFPGSYLLYLLGNFSCAGRRHRSDSRHGLRRERPPRGQGVCSRGKHRD